MTRSDLVDIARAIIRLADDLAQAEKTIAGLEVRLETARQGALRSAEERTRLLLRLNAVSELHWEREVVSCGDGCCHEGLGTCRYCDEPWPCKTYRVAEGEDPRVAESTSTDANRADHRSSTEQGTT